MSVKKKKKILRVTTIPLSLVVFCQGVLKELSQWYEVVAVSSPGETLDKVGKREGVRTIAVSMQRHISPLKDLCSLLHLIRVFLREKPQMVHSMTPKAGLLSMMASWIVRVPVRIHTFTGLVFPTATGLTKRILMLTDWITCACATHIIPEGEGVRADLLNNHITNKDIRVLGYGNVRGIDLEHYRRSEEVMSVATKIHQDGIFTFVFVGRIVGDKGINELVEAFSRLHDVYPDTRLLLVGPYETDMDPISKETQDTIATYGSIETVGAVSDVRPYFAASDALVFPSYREGFPNVVIEAGAMGLPSIVTDINGSREIIRQGENGVIIPTHSAEAIYDAMEQFVEDRESTLRMASNARQMVASRYEQSFVREQLYDFYRKVLS